MAVFSLRDELCDKKQPFFPGKCSQTFVSDFAFDENRWPNEMLRVPVYSGVLKLKNVNKKRLCWQAKIARHRFAHIKAFFFLL